MCAKSVGRPKSKGQPMVIKPYLSDEAFTFMSRQSNKSELVAELIESKAKESQILNKELRHYIQKAKQEIESSGIIFHVPTYEYELDIHVEENSSVMARDWNKYLKIIDVDQECKKLIARENTQMQYIGFVKGKFNDLYQHWYLVLNGDAAFAISHICEASFAEIPHACSMDSVPASLLLALKE